MYGFSLASAFARLSCCSVRVCLGDGELGVGGEEQRLQQRAARRRRPRPRAGAGRSAISLCRRVTSAFARSSPGGVGVEHGREVCEGALLDRAWRRRWRPRGRRRRLLSLNVIVATVGWLPCAPPGRPRGRERHVAAHAAGRDADLLGHAGDQVVAGQHRPGGGRVGRRGSRTGAPGDRRRLAQEHARGGGVRGRGDEGEEQPDDRRRDGRREDQPAAAPEHATVVAEGDLPIHDGGP